MSVYERLLDFTKNIDVVDTHEHFAPEKYHLTNHYTFFNWFMPYIQFDLAGAGMDQRYMWRGPSPDEVDDCYNEVEEYWPYVRHLSYARPFRMALKEFYGFDDLTKENYRELGERMMQTRRAGRYKEILQDRCHIQYMLNQVGEASFPDDPYMRGGYFPLNIDYSKAIDGFDGSMEDFVQAQINELRLAKKKGAVLIKFDTTSFLHKPDRHAAEAEYTDAHKGGSLDQQGAFTAYLFDRLVAAAGELDIVVCIHTGVWGNINYKNPLLVYDVIERHPDVIFDVYHMGMPFVNECGFIGKNYPNAYLNMCWSHIVSEEMAAKGLDDWLGYVPYNKMFAFGGDFSSMPENIWAHLEMAKQNVCRAFARRIDAARIDYEGAEMAIRCMFYDNPVRVYKLKD